MTKELVTYNYGDEQKFNIKKERKDVLGVMNRLKFLMSPRKTTRGTVTTEAKLSFQDALYDLKDDDTHGVMISFAMASAELNGYTNAQGKVTGSQLIKWAEAYLEFSGEQLKPGYNLIRPDEVKVDE